MFSIPEGFTNNSTILPITPTQVKKPSARKSLCIFTNILYAKKRNAIQQVWAAKSKRKAIKAGTTIWTKKAKQKLNSKMNDQIKKSLYNWIIRHPEVFEITNF